MKSRQLVCNDPKLAEFIKHNFIPISGDDVAFEAAANRGTGANKFMKRVFDQNRTRGSQGFWAATSSGKLLFSDNSYDPDRVLEGLQRAVEEYRDIPRRHRVLSGQLTSSDDIPLKKRPEGIIDIRVTKRSMPTTKMPLYDVRHPTYFHFEYLWLKPHELAGFVPPSRKVGAKTQLPRNVVRRFWLNSLLVLESRTWEPQHIKTARMTSTITAIEGDDIHLTLKGNFRMVADDYRWNDGWYAGRLLGKVVVSASTGELRKFDAVALGDDVILTERGPEQGPPENIVGAYFGINQPNDNAKMFPSIWPEGYRDW